MLSLFERQPLAFEMMIDEPLSSLQVSEVELLELLFKKPLITTVDHCCRHSKIAHDLVHFGEEYMSLLLLAAANEVLH